MPRVTCAACGAPSVLGASRCPKCLAPFGGESPTAGVVLVEPSPRPAGPVPSRRWLAIALGGVGLVGGVVAVLMARGRPTSEVAPSASPAQAADPALEVPVAPQDAVTDTATSIAEASPPRVIPPATAGDPEPVAPGGVASAMAASEALVGADTGATFAYETMTWVRVRSAPENEAPVFAVLAPGTRVEVEAIGRGWLTIRWEGRTGWVGASLLTRVR